MLETIDHLHIMTKHSGIEVRKGKGKTSLFLNYTGGKFVRIYKSNGQLKELIEGENEAELLAKLAKLKYKFY